MTIVVKANWSIIKKITIIIDALALEKKMFWKIIPLSLEESIFYHIPFTTKPAIINNNSYRKFLKYKIINWIPS